MKKQEYHQYIQKQKNIYQKYYPSFIEIFEEHILVQMALHSIHIIQRDMNMLSMVCYLLLI